MSDLTRNELLELLIEECAEVIQAATKCLRFGYDRNWPGYGLNSEVLAKECGEVSAVMMALDLDRDVMTTAGATKIARAMHWKSQEQEDV